MDKIKKFEQYLILQGLKPLPYLDSMISILKNVKALNQDTINDYFLNFNKKIETYNMHIKALKKWKECFGIDIVLPKYRKRENLLPKYLDEKYFREEILKKIGVIFNKKKTIKVRALLLFMFYTGIRKSEIINLKRKDIFLLDKKAIITEIKTKKQRVVFFTNEVAEALITYFETEEERPNAFNLTKQRINYIFRLLKQNFGDKRDSIFAHAFRHSFAVNAIRKNVPLSVVKKLLGHSNIKTTMRYVQVDDKALEEIYREHIK